MTYQNAGRLPIIDQTIGISYSIEVNPFGDDDEVCGYYVCCNDPRQKFPQIIGRGYDTPEEAEVFLREVVGEAA